MRGIILAFLIIVLSCQPNSQVRKPITENPLPDTFPPVQEEILSEKIQIDYDSSLWTDIATFLPNAKLDIRYATVNNFVKKQLYDCPRCWLRPEVAKALELAAIELASDGYGIVLFDCYRPYPVQEKLWEIMPNAAYVTPPSRGSMHNRGKAVDLSLIDSEGNELDMGTPYDFFGRAAHIDYRGHTEEIQERRDLLRAVMLESGFKGIRTEWWHYSYGGETAAELSSELWNCN